MRALQSYRWSSCRAYLGHESFSWLETDSILSRFSRNVGKARLQFAAFVGERLPEGRRAAFHGETNMDSRIFGDDDFVSDVLSETDVLPEQKPDVPTVIAAVKKLYEITDNSLQSQSRERLLCEARGVAAWATLELSGGKLADLARIFKRAPSTLTCAVRQIEKRYGKEPLLAKKMERLRGDLQISNYQILTPEVPIGAPADFCPITATVTDGRAFLYETHVEAKDLFGPFLF